ncbi:Spo0B domain-containing protein [Thermoanaerobacterium sp. RBIITD]|uniref:Spo0B domain-containing protein n=1 Tax=Thermoanaerobacterium sp. RBIITD TaxID=1550240 RepID=UPI000BB9463B|nr:Spo0B domain-containing protein [Thermoanaerobacterium sp. RBIITD]SNX55161.1 Sensor_kinase_SpoOB-type, alpha-helical domain [Thermoanaerobacterium sp. RBIITD]
MTEIEDLFVKYINMKRHQYLNDLQVILGYAQLGKLDKISEYVHKVINEFDEEREIFNNNNMDSILKYIKNKDMNA